MLLLLLLLLLRLLLLAQVCCAALELMRPIGSGVKLPGAPTVASEPPPPPAAAAAGPSLLLLLLLVPLPLSQLLRPLLAPPAVFLRFRGEASGPKISPQPLFPSKAPRGARRNGASWVVGIVCRASFDFFRPLESSRVGVLRQCTWRCPADNLAHVSVAGAVGRRPLAPARRVLWQEEIEHVVTGSAW